ncbi:MAG TPA: FAD-dependent monooxygenase, partial [Chloroflexota bacterium]|nr:FAD-dependent monooxygenase [Chloroflexota bacterium]
MSSQTDVLVVGAGPVGMTLAAEVLRHGASCRVIDGNEGPSQLSKAIAVHARSLAMLDDMGIADRLIEKGVKVGRTHIHLDGQAMPTIELDAIGPPFPYVLCVSQSETEELLDRHVREMGERVERRVELESFDQDADGVTATLRAADGTTEQLRAKYIAGADGAHSTVREQTQTGFEGVAYPELVWLGDVKVSWEKAPDELHVWISEDGGVYFFPLPGRFRIIAQPKLPADAARTAPTLEQLQAFAVERVGVPIELSEPGWLAAFAINRRLVTTMRPGPRTFLLGDAAHIHSPAGGQGMNTGMQDAYNLAWKLALVLSGQAPEALLDSFEAERRPVIQAMERGTDAMSNVSLATGIKARTRDHLAPLLLGIGAVRHKFAHQISMLPIEYGDSPLVSGNGHTGRGKPSGGQVVVDAGRLQDGNGAETSWLDVVRGTNHVVVAFAGDEPAERAADAARAVAGAHADAVQTKVMVLGGRVPDGLDGEVVLDPEGEAHERFGLRHGGIVVVRPDQYL